MELEVANTSCQCRDAMHCVACSVENGCWQIVVCSVAGWIVMEGLPWTLCVLNLCMVSFYLVLGAAWCHCILCMQQGVLVWCGVALRRHAHRCRRGALALNAGIIERRMQAGWRSYGIDLCTSYCHRQTMTRASNHLLFCVDTMKALVVALHNHIWYMLSWVMDLLMQHFIEAHCNSRHFELCGTVGWLVVRF